MAAFAPEVPYAYPSDWTGASLGNQLPSVLPGGYSAAEYSHQKVSFLELNFIATVPR
jgi:hypothetical protein